MIITELKTLEKIAQSLKEYNKIFLVGCGECATTCKTGGKDELLKMQQELEKLGKVVTGSCIPGAPCVAARLKRISQKYQGLKQTQKRFWSWPAV